MQYSEVGPVASFDAGRPDLAPYGLTCVRWQPSRMPRPDRHNELELNLLHTGRLTYLLRGRYVTVEAGRLTAFWALYPHQVVDFEGTDTYYVATVPFAQVLRWALPPDFRNRLLAGAVVQEANDTRHSLDKVLFACWLQDLNAGSAETAEITLLEMEARLRRLARSYRVLNDTNNTSGASNASLRSLSKVERMAVFVAAHYQEPLRVEDIAKVVGLHPDYANALFRSHFGMSLGRYVLEHRIAHAQRMLVTTEASITSIAFESGFGSISRFNVAFRTVTGCTPTEYRRHHRL